MQIAQNLNELKSHLDEVDPDVLADTLESLEGEFSQKVEWLIGYTKELAMFADACKQEEERLAARRKAFDKKIDGIKDFIKSQMIYSDLKKLNFPLFTVSVQLNPPAVKFEDELLVPLDYKVTKIIETIDKKAILEALKSGDVVPGCYIEQGQSLRIK
jgi:predicted nuclease with TOPRIM domain